MNASAKAYIDTLESKGLKYDVDERDDAIIVSCGMQAKNTSVRVRAIIDDDGTHVGIRCYGFASVPENKFANALLTCNDCNNKYRWVKFVIDSDLDVNAEDDAIVSPDTAGDEIFELLLRMIGIVDDVYPEFMKSIWS